MEAIPVKGLNQCWTLCGFQDTVCPNLPLRLKGYLAGRKIIPGNSTI